MAGKRKAYTPFSTSSEAGTTTAPVEGYIDVDQEVKPIVDTGFVDKQGIWQGHTTSDTEFSYYSKDEAIANGAEIQAPANIGILSMVGFTDLQIALRVTNGGNYAIKAIMASDGLIPYYNLIPPNAAAALKMNIPTDTQEFKSCFEDSAESLTADVWNIFYLANNLKNQARLGFSITNNSGDISTIESMFLRLV